MATKKYPIGTKIRFSNITIWHDFYGKTGVIVDIVGGFPLLYLPDSIHRDGSCFSTKERPVTVQCGWDEIELLVAKKNEQLLFSFME